MVAKTANIPRAMAPVHYAAGNMELAPEPGSESDASKAQLYVYDAWNRLVEVWHDDGVDPDDPDDTPDRTLTRTGTQADTLLVTYRYDGLNRRIVKLVGADPANPSEEYDYYYNTSWQVLEVRKDGSSYPYKQYVWDLRYIDAPVLRWRDADENGSSMEETLYYTNDANFNVTALVDASDGSVVERYTYDPYGQPTVRNGESDPDGDEWDEDTNGTDVANEILYCGYRYDPETGLYHVRRRPYHPTLGRWPVRDFEGYADGMSLYEYGRSMPTLSLDPNGTKCCVMGVQFGASHKPKLTMWENPNPDAPDTVAIPGTRLTGYAWRLQHRVEITAYLTGDSDPKDCVMRQKARITSYKITTKNTRVQDVERKAERKLKPDWPIKGGKPQPNTDWDKVEYGEEYGQPTAMFWDEPGVKFYSELDKLKPKKTQQYKFSIRMNFETTIYDKAAGRKPRWRGRWTMSIAGDLHIEMRKAVKRTGKNGGSLGKVTFQEITLKSAKSGGEAPVPTREVEIPAHAE